MVLVLYIIPGFGEYKHEQAYVRLRALCEKQGFVVCVADITWKYRVMSQYVDEFLSQVKPSDELYVLGFSYGAMVAVLSAPTHAPRALILCSLSPCFQEDLHKFKNSWKAMTGVRRMKDFEQYSFTTLAQQVSCKTVIVSGMQELDVLKERARASHEVLYDSELIWVDAPHDISHPEYQRGVEDIVRSL